MARAARTAYVVLVWLFLAGLVVQVFAAGLGIFSPDPRDIGLHIGLGWTLHLAPILILAAAALGRVGRTTLWWVGGLVVATLIQPFLALADGTSVIVAALHPVNAVLLVLITARLALDGRRLLTEATPQAE